MKTLIFSDVHGNSFGLEAIVEHARGNYDAVLCLGDVVGYGAHPNECCEIVRGLVSTSQNGACLLGNHDAAALGIIDASWFNHVAREAIEWTGEQLENENQTWLESLKPTFAANQIGDFEAVHGSLREPLEEYIVDAETALGTLEKMESQLCFFGHTHVAVAWMLGERKKGFFQKTFGLQNQSLREGGEVKLISGNRYLINPGSCGQPRDGNRDARYAIYDSEKKQVEIFAVEYDWQAAREAILEAGLPAMLGDRLAIGR